MHCGNPAGSTDRGCRAGRERPGAWHPEVAILREPQRACLSRCSSHHVGLHWACSATTTKCAHFYSIHTAPLMTNLCITCADDKRSGSGSIGGAKASGPSSAEALLSFLVAEFGDGRSIAAVVPLQARLAALEPELLGLSPEQAEDTQL